jgi:hypothetical protein
LEIVAQRSGGTLPASQTNQQQEPAMRFINQFSAYGMLVEPPARLRLRRQPGAWRVQLGRSLVSFGLKLMTPARG